MGNGNKRDQEFMAGYRPVVRAHEGRMLGIRQPLDWIFEKLEEAEHWYIYAMVGHYERQVGISDAEIHSFKGMVDDWGPPSNPVQLWDIQRMCDEGRGNACGPHE